MAFLNAKIAQLPVRDREEARVTAETRLGCLCGAGEASETDVQIAHDEVFPPDRQPELLP